MNYKTYLLVKKQLKSDSIYAYCPCCYQRIKSQTSKSMTYKDILQPLFYIKELWVWKDKDGNDCKSVEEHYHCDRCNGDYTDRDFVKAYCVDLNGNKYTDETLVHVEEVPDPTGQKVGGRVC